MEKCVNCKYYREGICTVPMWVEGTHIPEIPVTEENRCWLHEERSGE